MLSWLNFFVPFTFNYWYTLSVTVRCPVAHSVPSSVNSDDHRCFSLQALFSVILPTIVCFLHQKHVPSSLTLPLFSFIACAWCFWFKCWLHWMVRFMASCYFSSFPQVRLLGVFHFAAVTIVCQTSRYLSSASSLMHDAFGIDAECIGWSALWPLLPSLYLSSASSASSLMHDAFVIHGDCTGQSALWPLLLLIISQVKVLGVFLFLPQ